MARRPNESWIADWVPVLLYVTLIAVVSSQPGLKPPLSFTYSDKFAHIGEYFVLGLLLRRALRASMPKDRGGLVAALTVGIGIAIGVGDEFLQSFIPGRESGLPDVIADAIGIALSLPVAGWFARRPGPEVERS